MRGQKCERRCEVAGRWRGLLQPARHTLTVTRWLPAASDAPSARRGARREPFAVGTDSPSCSDRLLRRLIHWRGEERSNAASGACWTSCAAAGSAAAAWPSGLRGALRALASGQNVRNSLSFEPQFRSVQQCDIKRLLKGAVSASGVICMVRQRGVSGGVAEWSKGCAAGALAIRPHFKAVHLSYCDQKNFLTVPTLRRRHLPAPAAWRRRRRRGRVV